MVMKALLWWRAFPYSWRLKQKVQLRELRYYIRVRTLLICLRQPASYMVLSAESETHLTFCLEPPLKEDTPILSLHICQQHLCTDSVALSE